MHICKPGKTSSLDERVWVADQGDGTYKNPILHADYSDPDVVGVGEDYFMVSSSFNYSPCLPVLHSKDLVSWKVINYVFERLPFSDYNVPQPGRGVWAPSIRYHDDKFWVFFATPDEGIFMSTAKDPFSKWSPLVHVKKTRGLIDPCPFWDDDGNAYLVYAFAKSRIGFNSKLALARMKPDGTELLDEGKFIFDGTEEHPTIEGPKMYKKNSYYYIFAPAGGVKTGWQTILRAKDIYGPYEGKIVLHQGSTPTNGPHQGGWIETPKGESWFIHFQDADAYGRIVHLQPVKWIDGWPMMGEILHGEIGEPVKSYRKPDIGKEYPPYSPETTDYFDGEKLGLQWQWQANMDTKWYSLSEREDALRLYSIESTSNDGLVLWDAPNVMTQMFQAPAFRATTKLEFNPEKLGDMAGLVITGIQYSYIAITKTEDGIKLEQIMGDSNEEVGREWEVTSQIMDKDEIYLRVTVDERAECRFSYSLDGENFSSIGKKFKAKPGKWVGSKVGLFCINAKGFKSNGYCDYRFFQVAKI